MATKKHPKLTDPEFMEALQRLLWHFTGNRKALAMELGIHLSTLSRWLNGRTLPSQEERARVLALLRRREDGSVCRLLQLYSSAPPRLQTAIRALVERGIDAWEEFGPVTRDELCDLFLKIKGDERGV